MSKVLIVEDRLEIANLLAAAVDRAEHSAIVTHSAEGAREHLSTDSIEVLLVDVAMPGESGIELVTSLRADPAYQELAIIFVTANPELVDPGLAVQRVIRKPFKFTEIAEALNEVTSA